MAQGDLGPVLALDHNPSLAALPYPHAKVLHLGIKVQAFGQSLDEDVCEIWHGFGTEIG